MLTARFPFPRHESPVEGVVPLLAADRGIQPSGLLQANPAVTPAVEAILGACLDPDPRKRYPSARALREDLERHLAHQPLKHQHETSWRERLRKWRRRHPRL